MKRIIILTMAVLMLSGLVGFWGAGCGAPEDYAAVEMDVPAEDYGEEALVAEDTTADGATGEGDVPVEEKVIKEGQVEYETDDVEVKVKEINELVEDYEGSVVSSSLSKVDERERATLTIKVESDLFDSIYRDLGEIEDLVKIESTAEDVTLEYVDLQSRLEVYRAQEARYLEMLQDADTIEEMLEVERELERIRVEIENIEGRLKYFDSITDYSHINIFVEQRKAVAAGRAPDNVWEEFLFSFTEGWGFFAAFLIAVLSALIWALPFLITIAVIVFLIVKIRRRSKAKTN